MASADEECNMQSKESQVLLEDISFLPETEPRSNESIVHRLFLVQEYL